MFVEYMALKDKKEAQALFDASVKMKSTEKDELYIVKDNMDYQVILKVKKYRKKFNEQRWFLSLNEKGVTAKREMTNAYIFEVFITIVSAILFAVLLTMAFIKPDMMVFFVWISMVALFVFLFVSWRKLFKPSVALKIFLIRVL